MIINLICGGLGNQLFQISAGFAHSLRLKTSYRINYEIGMGPGQGNIHNTYKDTVYSKIKCTTNNIFQTYTDNINENIYAPIPFEDNLCLIGYFQSQKYFKDCENEIRNLFTFPKEKTKKIREKFSKFKKKKLEFTLGWVTIKKYTKYFPLYLKII